MDAKLARLRVLFLEDSDTDAELIHRKLSDDFDCPVDMDTARCENEFVTRLSGCPYDLIMADYTLPGYCAPDALEHVKELCPDVPFICVSGTIGEEAAVELLKQGATDYVLKDRLGRLSYSVLRALEGAREAAARRQAEQKLIKMVTLLEETQHIASVGSLEWMAGEGSMTWSDEVFSIYGLDMNCVKAGWELAYTGVDPADVAKLTEAWEAAVRELQPFDESYWLTRPDGKRRCVRMRVAVKSDGMGKLASLVGSVQDVTELLRAEEEHKRHSSFEFAIRRMAQDFINIPTDRLDDAIVGALGMVAEYCQADRVTVYRFDWDKNIACHYLEWDKMPRFRINPDCFAVPTTAMTALTERLKAGYEYVRYGLENLLEDSEALQFAQKLNSRSKCALPMTADGNLIGMVSAYAIDNDKMWTNDELTAMRLFAELLTSVLMRRDREEALCRLVEDRQLVLDSTTDGVAMLDRDGTVLNINRAFAARHHVDGSWLIGRSFNDVLPQETAGGLFERRLGCIRKAYDAGISVVDEDERCGFRYSNRYFPVVKDGRCTAVALFSTDISARRNAEEELRKRLETEARLNVMTDFFTNVSHELKTPLALILMQLDMMRTHMGNVGKMKDLMADATLNAYRLTRLVSNLLDITKMDAGFLKLNPRSKDVVQLLKCVADSVKEYTAHKKLDLSFVSNVDTKYMNLDVDKIERAVLNLLSNAIKHTPEGGQIVLEFRDGPKQVAIRVADTGGGIPSDKLDIVFDRFAQVNNRMNRGTEGCGIGLALVKSMTELHGGKVWVESEPGRGSVFTIELPVRHGMIKDRSVIVEGFDLKKKVKMELSDLYIKQE